MLSTDTSCEPYEDPAFDAFLSEAIDNGIIDQIEKMSIMQQELKDEKQRTERLAVQLRAAEGSVARVQIELLQLKNSLYAMQERIAYLEKEKTLEEEEEEEEEEEGGKEQVNVEVEVEEHEVCYKYPCPSSRT